MKLVDRDSLICTRCNYREPHKDKPGQPLADHFPYQSLRSYQKEVLDEIEKVPKSTKFIVLEAPVGFGKSAIGASLARYHGSAHILTSTKQLQDQYASDFGFPIVKGKSNFRCRIPTNKGVYLPCNKGRCEADWKLRDCPHYMGFEEYLSHPMYRTETSGREHLTGGNICRYYEQKWAGFKAPITVYNYPFLLSEIKYAKDVPHRSLLICDEVHDLEKQLVGFAKFTLNEKFLQYYWSNLGKDDPFYIADKGEDDPSAWLEVLSDVARVLEEFHARFITSDKMQEQAILCKGTLESLESFKIDLQEQRDNWVINLKRAEDGSIEEVIFQPIDVKRYSHALFGIADNVLLMSATICSMENLRSTLGIKESEGQRFIRVGQSTFPIENRLIYPMNIAYLNRSSMNASIDIITQAINEIMNNHPSERGIIHTTSYWQANYIISHMPEPNSRRLVSTEGSFDRSNLLRKHNLNDSSTLISPSLYQGVDLKDDLSRFQVIVKVPYPDLSERRTLTLLKRDRKWYEWQTALRLVQTYGRSIRGESDYAVTYILDSNFSRFIRAHADLFPGYFLEALRDRKSYL